MEQQTVSLKLCITELTQRQIGKDGSDFVYVSDKKKVPKEILNEANLLKAKKEEDIRVSSINAYTQSFIYLKYPQPKQSSANLGVYDEDYKNEMVAFIKRVVDLSDEAINNGISFDDYKTILESE